MIKWREKRLISIGRKKTKGIVSLEIEKYKRGGTPQGGAGGLIFIFFYYLFF